MPKNKRKGTAAEIELYKIFLEKGFRPLRVAGSGNMENADCDLVVMKDGKTFCVEVKASKKPRKYVEKEQISRLLKLSKEGGGYPVVAFKFNHQGWFFCHPSELEDSGKCLGVKLKDLKENGKRFDEFFRN
jgi:Holliday junction resolvase